MAQSLATPTLEQIEELQPEELFQWAFAEYGERAGILTSFQTTGCAMIDMARRAAPGLRIMTVDTLRLPDESYAFMETIEQRYGIAIERFQPDARRVERMVDQHGEYLFFDSKEKQEFCCAVRKVEPNRRALATLDVWFTGLRRDQSSFRLKVPKVSSIEQEGRRIIKIAPLVDWTEEQLETYLAEHSVPKHPLYALGYTSIGCKICTTPTRPGEDKRAGRWRWFNYLGGEDKKECGIHTSGSGI